MRWLSAVVPTLVLGACVDMDDSSSNIVGTSGDVATASGDYTGYRVITPCEDSWVNVGVSGTGSVEVSDKVEITTLGQELAATLRDVSSVWGWGGYGLGCEPGVGTSLDTNDWRDVDALIERTGEFLRERDLSLQVSIRVGGIPVPH